MSFEDVTLSEISQSQKTNTVWLHLHEVTKSSHSYRDSTQDGGRQGLRSGEEEAWGLMSTKFQFGKREVLGMGGGDGHTTM